jgi:hypothetical protein
LTNIETFDLTGVHDQLPGRSKASLWRLLLPEVQVKRPVQVLNPASALYEIVARHSDIITGESVHW